MKRRAITSRCSPRIGPLQENLIKMASHAYLEGFYASRGSIGVAQATQRRDHLPFGMRVRANSCKTLLRTGGGEPDWEQAKRIATWFHDIFGERYFLRFKTTALISSVGGLRGYRRSGEADRFAAGRHERRSLREPRDAEAQDVLLCITTGKFRTDTKRMKMEGSEFFFARRMKCTPRSRARKTRSPVAKSCRHGRHQSRTRQANTSDAAHSSRKDAAPITCASW